MAGTGPLELQVDLTVFGDSDVIEARLPRTMFGRLAVGDDVMVVDDGVDPRLFRVVKFGNGDRDVRLLAAGPSSLDATIRAKAETANFGAEAARENVTTVALGADGRLVEHRPDGTSSVLGAD